MTWLIRGDPAQIDHTVSMAPIRSVASFGCRRSRVSRPVRLAAVLVAVVAASLTACSSSDSLGADAAASSPKVSVTAPASARPSSPASHAAPRKQSDVKIVKAGVEDHPA